MPTKVIQGDQNMKVTNKRKQAGFTLIEMMVVVAVIGLLIAWLGQGFLIRLKKLSEPEWHRILE